jgi:integrase
MVPMRIKNMVALRIGTHILIDRRGKMTLVVPNGEVKNRVGLDVKLPAVSAELLDLYLSHYRPLMEGANSDCLFPGHSAGGAKGYEAMRQNIKNCILTRCGLEMNPHLFRHLAAMIILTDNPGAHGQAQTVLGHKSINTTAKFYAGMEKPAAFGHFADVVTKLRDDVLLPPVRSSKVRRAKLRSPKGPGKGNGKDGAS